MYSDIEPGRAWHHCRCIPSPVTPAPATVSVARPSVVGARMAAALQPEGTRPAAYRIDRTETPGPARIASIRLQAARAYLQMHGPTSGPAPKLAYQGTSGARSTRARYAARKIVRAAAGVVAASLLTLTLGAPATSHAAPTAIDNGGVYVPPIVIDTHCFASDILCDG